MREVEYTSKEEDGHILCGLAEGDFMVLDDEHAPGLVIFREALLYAFFMNIPKAEQKVKTFTLCLKMEEHDSLALLIENSRKDPLVATGFVRTLRKLEYLRKVVIELYGTFVPLDGKHPEQSSRLFQHLSQWLGPCIDEEVQQDMSKGETFFKRFVFFPSRDWLSEQDGGKVPLYH